MRKTGGPALDSMAAASGTHYMPTTTDWIIAIATLVNVVVSWYLWTATRKSAEATAGATILAQRTYSATIRPWLGTRETHANIDHIAKRFEVFLQFENGGNVPAMNVEAEWNWYLDGELLPRERSPRAPSNLFPSQTGTLVGAAAGPQYEAIIGHELQIACTLQYTSPDGENHRTDERRRFDWTTQQFFVLSGVAT